MTCNYFLNGQRLDIDPTSIKPEELHEKIRQYLQENYQIATEIYNSLEKTSFTQQKREKIPDDQIMDYIADYVSKNFGINVKVLSEEGFRDMVRSNSSENTMIGSNSSENAFVSFSESANEYNSKETRPTIYIKQNSEKDILIHELLHIILEVGYQIEEEDDVSNKQPDGTYIKKQMVKDMVNKIYNYIVTDAETNEVPLMDLSFLSKEPYKDLPFEQQKKEVAIRAITACIKSTDKDITNISGLFTTVFSEDNEKILLHLIKKTFGIADIVELENKERGLKGISVKDILTYTIDLKQAQSLLFTYNKNDSIEYNKVLSLRNKAKESVMIDTIIEDMIKRGSLTFECK